jgi:hypothetical protein
MNVNTVLTVLGVFAGVVLLQQIVSAFFRVRKTFDHHDEAAARRMPIEYVFEDTEDELKQPTQISPPTKISR